MFYDSEWPTTDGETGEINRRNERKTDQSRERAEELRDGGVICREAGVWAGRIHRCFKVLI